MPRSGDEARRRLQQAALDLFGEQGFDRTTTAQIAARAGVTERTYFRHFTDKREVLFDGQEQFQAELLEGLAAAPDGPPLLMLFHAYRRSLARIEGNRPFSEPRFQVIGNTPALQEREAAKLASLNQSLTEALVARGVDERRASLATEVGMAALGQAIRRWIGEPAPGDLDGQLRRAFVDLKGLAGDLVVPRTAARTRRPAQGPPSPDPPVPGDTDALPAVMGGSTSPGQGGAPIEEPAGRRPPPRARRRNAPSPRTKHG